MRPKIVEAVFLYIICVNRNNQDDVTEAPAILAGGLNVHKQKDVPFCACNFKSLNCGSIFS